MAECYPQGCPPCDGEIVFPESPINGQRYCINIGLDPNTQENMQKCWVYDHCIPGWRAEGPTVSPITFKGGVDLTLTPAGNNISNPEAGDYYIVEVGSADVGALTAQQWLDSHWATLQHEVPRGSFIMWSGTEWVEVPRPCAEIVQSDWLQTDDTADDYIKNKPTIPPLVGNADGGSMTVTADEDTPSYCGTGPVELSAKALPVSAAGDPVVGIFEFTWQVSTDSGTIWTDLPTVRDAEVSYQRTNSRTIETYNGTDVYRLKVVFTDLYGHELLGFSGVITPQAGSTASITTQPVSLDLSTNTVGSFTVATDGTNPTYTWLINGVTITGATTPDVGYTFSNWDTATLGVERTDANAGSYNIQVRTTNDSACNPMLLSTVVLLDGPGGTTNSEIPTFTPTIWTAQYGDYQSHLCRPVGEKNDGSSYNGNVPLGAQVIALTMTTDGPDGTKDGCYITYQSIPTV